MASVACPFCFSPIDSSRLAFQCMGRGTPKCERIKDEKREDLTGSQAESYPTFTSADKRAMSAACPHCGGTTSRRACPECHTHIPHDFIDSSSPLIGIVGARGSGKSVWMTVLARQLREGVGARFGAHVGFASDSPDGTGSMASWLEDRENAIFKSNMLPQATMGSVNARRLPLVLRWQQPAGGLLRRGGADSTVLSFLDTAGEDQQSLDDVFNLRYLGAIQALIIVVDPFRFGGALTMANIPEDQRRAGDGGPTEVVERMTEVLRTEHQVKPKRKITIPTAVVFTKLDAFFSSIDSSNPLRSSVPAVPYYDDAMGREVHDQMLSLMNRWGAGPLDTHMSLNYERYRFFGVSSLGAEPDYDRMVVDSSGVRPHRVEDPLLWLLNVLGVVPKA